MRSARKPMQNAVFGSILILAVLSVNCTGFTQQQLRQSNHIRKQQPGLISFDLDDTLWHTSRTVDDANHVMIQAMNEAGFGTDLPSFLDTTRQIRKGLEQPVTYSDLRKLAIRKEMNRVCANNNNNKTTAGNKDDPSSFDEMVDRFFSCWLQERHSAAERHLFPTAIEALETLKSVYPDACIAGITNGRGNPLDMPRTLAPYFDFCISGEEDSIFPLSKPHAAIYEASLGQYRALFPHHEQQSHFWCHIGDCLGNDVGASAAVGASAIWYSPDDEDEVSAASQLSSISNGNKKQPSWSTATQSDLKRRTELANAAKDKVAVKISCLSQLPRAIADLSSSACASSAKSLETA